MRRPTHASRALAVLGTILVFVGTVLVGVSVAASPRNPSISFTPTSSIGPAHHQKVFVRGSGFSHSSAGGLMECSSSPEQPTVQVMNKHFDLGNVPISCTKPEAVKTGTTGHLPTLTHFVLRSGVLGPPIGEIDSAGNPSTTDAQSFPCPPTSAQEGVGGQCELLFINSTGQSAVAPINFSFESTTTSTIISTTSSPTTQPCNPVSTTGTGVNSTVTPNTTATLTADPGTCIVNGTVVTFTGSGFQARSAGVFLECNSDPNQPTVSYEGSIPVSCTSPF